MNFTDLSFLLIPEVAMEADDITKQVNQIMGGKNAPAETKTDDQREEDLTQTDGIFNDINKDDAENDPVDTPQNDDPSTTQGNNPNDSAADQGDNPDDAMDPNNPDEGMDDQNMDQDPMTDDQQTPEDEGMSEENKSIFDLYVRTILSSINASDITSSNNNEVTKEEDFYNESKNKKKTKKFV